MIKIFTLSKFILYILSLDNISKEFYLNKSSSLLQRLSIHLLSHIFFTEPIAHLLFLALFLSIFLLISLKYYEKYSYTTYLHLCQSSQLSKRLSNLSQRRNGPFLWLFLQLSLLFQLLFTSAWKCFPPEQESRTLSELGAFPMKRPVNFSSCICRTSATLDYGSITPFTLQHRFVCRWYSLVIFTCLITC